VSAWSRNLDENPFIKPKQTHNIGIRMRSSVTLLLFLVLSFSIITSLPARAESKTIIVPDDYPTLDAAIENAINRDTIHVKSGRYEILNDTLTINKTLSIIGEGTSTTFLTGPGTAYGTLAVRNEADGKAEYMLLSTEIRPSNFIPPPKIAFQVNADNFKISQLTIDNCDIGISIIGNGPEISHTKMPGVAVVGSHSQISDNIITGTLTISGSYQTIKRNYAYIESDGSFNVIADNRGNCDIHLQGSFNIVMGNSFLTMQMLWADSNIICNNSINYAYIGDIDARCSNNTFSNNRFIGPRFWGVLMGSGSYNVFHDNLIANYTGSRSGYGIAIGGNHAVAENNTFYRNVLINNNKHVSANWEILGSGNYWDNGEEGNYWDDYTGSDINGDGIGDTPYIIEGHKWDDTAGGLVEYVFGQDKYPFMSPFDIDNISIELPEWTSVILNPSQNSSPSPEPILKTEPFPTTLAVASIATLAFISAGLLVYFKKRKR
jgi:nitrous oxidase accessory protein NosD